MIEKFYLLNLTDPATPGFCSFNKMYVGTEKMINQVVDNFENNKSYPDTISAVHSYFDGNINAEHNIAYTQQKVLTPIRIEAEHKMKFGNMKWTHTNIWGFPYNMRCDSVNAHQIVFMYNKRYYRFIKVYLENLSYEGVRNEWIKLRGGFWGNDSVLNVYNIPSADSFIFNNLLFIEEECYDNSTLAVKDIYIKNKINFKKVCDEIFADG